jgi:cytochrome c-type biogenesis protein CcmH
MKAGDHAAGSHRGKPRWVPGPPRPLRRARLPLVGARGPRPTGGGPSRGARGALRPLALFLFLAFSAHAVVDPREMLPDPAQEARAREIGRGLRCLVCQNQSIDDSNADLARDLRRIVRERIAAGDTDGQVVQFITDRYGDYVLLRPPLNAATIGLWIAPALILLAGGAVAITYLRRRRTAPADTPPLSAEERARLKQLTAE